MDNTLTPRAFTFHIPQPTTVIRTILVIFTLLLPFLYDSSVPEVSGDIRWYWTHLAAGLCLLGGLWAWWENRRHAETSLHWPLTLWWALGLAVWAAVSMVDSLSWERGIVLIKALYAQLIILAFVYAVWKPAFARTLAWLMALPLIFTSWVGICQFMGWNDAIFRLMLSNTAGLSWLAPLWPDGAINTLITFYLQSAVPGSTFANKNLAGSYTAMMLPIAAYCLITARAWYSRSLASLALSMGMLFLIYSRSRASWLALLAGLIIMAFAIFKTPALRAEIAKHITWKTLCIALLPTVILVAAFGSAISPVQGSYAVDRTPAQQVHALATSSWEEIGGRFAYNLNSLMIIKDYWFNGTGLGTFYTIWPAYHNAIVDTPWNSYNVMARPQRTHTDVIQAFDEMGIPGGFFYVALVLGSLVYAWKLRAHLATVGLFPLFAGLSLLVVGINATMDFPMQLPTAPALAALLMGCIAASYKHAFPSAGWHPRFLPSPIHLPMPALPITLALWVIVFAWSTWDDYYFRASNQLLKAAMIRIFSGVNDDETVRIINMAQQTYKWDPRIHEHVAVVYANYNGSSQMPLETRLEKIEWILSKDPWGANHLVNAGGLYLQLAEQSLNAGNNVVANRTFERLEDIYTRLQRVAGFSHFTWGIGGMVRMLQNKNTEAKALFEKALAIDPAYSPATHGLGIVNGRLGVAQPAAPVSP